LPITAVIVRSSANVYAGARTRMSAIAHGVILAVAVAAVPHVLNRIPLAALASILIMVGYKLAPVSLFRDMQRAGIEQWLPFGVTVLAIVMSDVLIGVLVGFAVGVAVVTRSNHYSAITMVHDDRDYFVKFKKDVSFLNKSRLHDLLATIPNGSSVVIDGTRAMFVDHDIYEVVDDFQRSAVHREIRVDVRNLADKQFSLALQRA
jgi:MFS superfamily sulfate permease-like transporter